MALIIGFAVPMANVVAVYGLARHSGANLLRELARNPLVVSTLAGLACNLAGLQLPGPVDTVLARLGAAAIALGILCVGASLAWEGGKGYGALIAWMLAVNWPRCRWWPCWWRICWACHRWNRACCCCSARCPRHRPPMCWPCAWAATGAWWPCCYRWARWPRR